MKFINRFAAVFVIPSLLLSSPVFAEDTSAIEKRLESLEQEVAILKRQLEVKKEDEVKKAQEYPVVTANAKDGFSIKSPDDNYKLKIGGYVQADGRFFTYNKKDASGGTSTFLARRVRPVFSGTVAHDFNFYVMPDFSSTSAAVVDAYAEYTKFPAFKIRAGKFKAPFSLENLQDSRYNNFAELGLPANLYPNRDIGVQVSGSLLKDTVTYGLGLFNGEADAEKYNGSAQGNSDNNNDKEIVGRIFVQPFKNSSISWLNGLGAGYAASYGHEEGTDLPTIVSPGQVSAFAYGTTGSTVTNITANGPHVRTSPQVSYYYKSLGLLGEYVDSAQDLSGLKSGQLLKNKFENKAWQVSGTYVLTGEDATYSGVKPRHDFNPALGNWGAFELAARYGVLAIDHRIFDQGFANLNTNISKENAWATGINWYLNNNFKLLLDFEQTKFDRGGSLVSGVSNPLDRKTENVITTRAQVAF